VFVAFAGKYRVSRETEEVMVTSLRKKPPNKKTRRKKGPFGSKKTRGKTTPIPADVRPPPRPVPAPPTKNPQNVVTTVGQVSNKVQQIAGYGQKALGVKSQAESYAAAAKPKNYGQRPPQAPPGKARQIAVRARPARKKKRRRVAVGRRGR
jgi:hypothetical protein